MPTKNIVPRATDEGEIGTSAKRWEKVHAKTGSFDYIETTTMSSKMYNDGSTIFGDDASDTHDFTGSVRVEGEISASLSVSASAFTGGAFHLTGALIPRIYLNPPATTSNYIRLNSSGDGFLYKGPGEFYGNITASNNGHVSASAFYGDGQYLTNLPITPGTLQDVTDLGSVTTNNITASGYYLGSSGEGIHDDDGTMRIDLQTTSQNAMILRAAENTNAGITGMQNLQINNENGKLAKIQTGKNTAGIRHLNIIDTSHYAPADPNHVARTGSDRGVLFATDITASFINLELRSTEDDSFSALDLIKHNALGIADTDYFGEAAASGFRLRYMEDDLALKIQSGDGTTVEDRLVIERDTGRVGIGKSNPSTLLHVSGNSDVYFQVDNTEVESTLRVSGTSTFNNFVNFQTTGLSPYFIGDATNSRIGIGTQVPRVPLDIYEMGGLTLAQSNIQNDSKGYWDISTVDTIISSSAGDYLKCDVTMPANEHLEIEANVFVHSQLGTVASNENELYLGLHMSGSSLGPWADVPDAFCASLQTPKLILHHRNSDASEVDLMEMVTAKWVLRHGALPAGTNFSVAISAKADTDGTGAMTLRYCDVGSTYYPPLTIKALTSVVPDTSPGS
jgi:hypothetical protein